MSAPLHVNELSAGDACVISVLGRAPVETTVDSYGRLYVYAAGFKFRREDGRRADGYTGQIWTAAGYAEVVRTGRMRVDLFELGVSVSTSASPELVAILWEALRAAGRLMGPTAR